MTARLLSVLLGLITTMFIFAGASRFEREAWQLHFKTDAATSSAAIISDGGEQSGSSASREDIVNLHVLAATYLAVAWACLHHSFFLLVAGPDEEFVLITAIRKKSARADRCFTIVDSFVNSNGKFFPIFLVCREVAENTVQLLGVNNTARVSDVQDVQLRAVLLALNLVVLPLAAVFTFRTWGATVAEATVVTLEAAFDNAFIIVGVLFQLDAASIVLGSVSDQISEHLPQLLPAILFVLQDQTPLMMLAEMANVQEEQQRQDVAARTIQALVRRRQCAATHKHVDRSTSWSNVLVDVRGSLGQAHAETRQRRPCSVKVQRQVRRCAQDVSAIGRTWTGRFFAAAGVVSIAFGVVLWAHVAISIQQIENACVARVGNIATCFRPRIYFKDTGLFARGDCHFDAVASANCSRSARLEAEPPEAATADFETMDQLRHVDVSLNAQLRTIPAGWSRIPRLASLNLTGCSNFVGLPFQLCRSRSLEVVALSGTVAEKQLNWSGQIRVTNASKPVDVSDACKIALQKTLVALDLSHNNFSLTCGAGECDPSQQLAFIVSLQRLSSLDLSHNAIVELTSTNNYFAQTSIVDRNSEGSLGSGVSLAGNPIRHVDMVASTGDRISRVLHTLRQNPLSTSLRTLRLSGAADLVLLSSSGGGERLLDASFSGLVEAKLDGSGITTIPPGSFQGLSSLQVLWLGNNKLTLLAEGAFDGLHALRNLKLHNNEIRGIEAGAFKGLSQVDYLPLNNNQLEHLDPETFRGMPRLSQLILSGNRLRTIDAAVFEGLKSVQQLYLFSNEIGSLSPGVFAGLDSLEQLYMWPGNPALGSEATVQNYSTWGLRNGTRVFTMQPCPVGVSSAKAEISAALTGHRCLCSAHICDGPSA